MSGRKVTDAIRSIVNAMDLQLECARVLHEALLAPLLTYGSETILYGRRRKDYGLGLYRWITSEVC